MIFWLIYIATCFIIVLLLIDMKKPKKYPPGPSFLPIVGNYLLYRSMHKKLGYHHLVWTYLDKKYGDVVGMKLGRNYVVAASGPNAIREVLTREDFDGRPDGFFFRLRTFGKRLGIVFSDGQFWKKQRKFSLQHLRSFGFGRKEMEEMIQDETRSLIQIFEDCCDRERFDIEDVRLKKLLQIVNDAFRLVDMSGGLINQMPYLRHIAPNACGYNKIMDVLTRMWQFLEETIAEHRKTMSYMQQPRDLIDAFLQKMEYTDDTSFTGIAHRAVRDTNLGGFNVPEGTIVLTNLYSIHMNEKVWKEPLQFRPERFLDDKNELVVDEKASHSQNRLNGVAMLATEHEISNKLNLKRVIREFAGIKEAADRQSMPVLLTLIVVFITLLLAYIIRIYGRPPGYPPGPTWAPIVGNLPQLRKLAKKLGGQHLALWQLAQEYNTQVLGLKLGGVTCTDGPIWKAQRNFVTTHLKDLGFGRNRMELMIKEEVVEILEVIRENSRNVQIGKLLAPSIINILWAFTSGMRIRRDDPQLTFDMSGGTLSQHPWLRYIAPERTGYNLMQQVNCDFKNLLMGTIKEHYKTWVHGKDEDLIYAYINEINAANGNNGIFTAGAQTTGSTLDFMFLVMILYPDIQKKVHSCIDAAFKKDDSITYQDRHRVPYIKAFILEMERYYAVVPISGPRRVLRDTTLEGYNIPKEYWKDPEVFRPERFLNEDGKVFNYERVINFGLGRRRCLGEILAKYSIFLIFVEVMRKYTISLWPGTKQPTGIPIPGITLLPEKYRAQFTPR
nr:unnamed protein product [Callosobruchus analis]